MLIIIGDDEPAYLSQKRQKLPDEDIKTIKQVVCDI